MFYRCQRFNIKPIKRPCFGFNKGAKGQPRAPLVWRTGLSGVPPDSEQYLSGAPGDSDSNSSPSGFLGSRRAIIHRTVRCAPDMSGAPRKLGLLNSPASGSRGSRSAKIHRTVRCTPGCPVCQRSNGHLRATVDSAKCTVEFRVSEQKSEGHRTVRCCTGLSGAT